MGTPVLSKEDQQFIRENVLMMPQRVLAEKIGCSRTAVVLFIKREGIAPGREIVYRFRSEAMRGKTTSTPEIDLYLKAHFLAVPEKTMARAINKSNCFVRKRLQQLNLVIPRDIIENRVKESRIQKGSVSYNKGMRVEQFMNAEAIERCKKTRYKTGHLPHNTKKDLDVSIRPDKRGVKYLHIRIALAEWIPLHRYNWIKVHGEIPKGMKLLFKDRNPFNCNIDNLELLTPGELMKRNSVHNYPAPIARIIQLRGALNRKINKHLKALSNG